MDGVQRYEVRTNTGGCRMVTTKKICNGPQCDHAQHSRGLCAGHYTQMRAGKPLRPLRRRTVAYKDEHGRTCTTCGHYKPYTAFYDDGKRSRCKECMIKEAVAYAASRESGPTTTQRAREHV